MLNFCDFIQVYVFTTNHHLNDLVNVMLSQLLSWCTVNKPFVLTALHCISLFTYIQYRDKFIRSVEHCTFVSNN